MMTGSPLLLLSIALIVSITGIIVLTRYFNVHAFFALLLAALTFGLIVGKPVADTLQAMQTGFGTLLQQIGLLVAFGSCLGILLEKTGAMEVISQHVLKLFGAKRSVFAMTFIGVIVGIPVFCDSGFIILSRLIPSVAAQAGVAPAQLSLALSSGLYTTHTLVPPTPGPLAGAANLGVSQHLSSVILFGLIASLPIALVSYYAAKKLGASVHVSHQPGDMKNLDSSISPASAFLPLVLPILLITTSNLPKVIPFLKGLETVFSFVGHPVIALALGMLFAFPLIKKENRRETPEWIATALKDAGLILLITGAGGAFGNVTKVSGIDTALKDIVSGTETHGVLFLFIAFCIAAVLKTAQGSTTSSIIITSSLLAPLTLSAGFEDPTDLSILLVAIGGGAMTASHANDSYFWVVSQFGGIAPRDAFRSFTVLTAIQGFTAFVTAVILYLLL